MPRTELKTPSGAFPIRSPEIAEIAYPQMRGIAPHSVRRVLLPALRTQRIPLSL